MPTSCLLLTKASFTRNTSFQFKPKLTFFTTKKKKPEFSIQDEEDQWVDGSMVTSTFGNGSNNNFSTVTEIEEEDSGTDDIHEPSFNLKHRIPGTISEEITLHHEGVKRSSCDPERGDEDIYIAVGKNYSSMDALKWALKQSYLKPSSVVYLIHVFPEVRHIPTPLGKFAKEQLSPDQVENYMSQERGKRRQLLQKFLDVCTTSQVNVDTLLIESDNIAKAVIDLIPILNIRKVVAGTTKSNLRKLRKGGGIAEQILKNAPDACEVKIICEGKEMNIIDQISSPRGVNVGEIEKGDPAEGSISPTCVCFARKFM